MSTIVNETAVLLSIEQLMHKLFMNGYSNESLVIDLVKIFEFIQLCYREEFTTVH
jgi:hypothetical protein